MTHMLERTSPKGQAFEGRCRRCGQTGFSSAGALLPCPLDHVQSNSAGLLEMLEPEPDPLRVKVHNKLKAMGRIK